ncbi:UNVERIFIED_ORG: hypothetical protein ABRZ91_003118 [Heyndrickxia coagulans]
MNKQSIKKLLNLKVVTLLRGNLLKKPFHLENIRTWINAVAGAVGNGIDLN